ncbi:MAG: hypothetical protein QG656_1595 [Candidatus Hydrogenedentes bacterium]|nr:hypothetical protein [Candidatus Hydrogenedentota bacterium]
MTIQKRTAGYSLLECLAYVAVLSVVINLAAGTFASSLRLSRLGTEAAARVDACEDIRRDFTDAVRGATGVAPSAGPYTTGADCIVLALPARDGANRYAILGQLMDDGQFYCVRAVEREGGLGVEHRTAYHRAFDAIRFACDSPDTAQTRSVTLELEPELPKRGDAPRPVYRFIAALRARNAEVRP